MPSSAVPARVRRAGTLMCAVFAIALAGLGAAAPSHAKGLPPQGVYDSCAPATSLDTCVEHLDELGRAGFKAVLNYNVWNASWEDLGAYAAAARAAGVKIIWPFNNRPWRTGQGLAAAYKPLVARCGCEGDPDFLEAAMNVIRSFPATWGYYVGDEVNPSEADQVRTLAARIRAQDN